MSSFKTKKGTELPLRDMKGKDYLDVQWRVVWFREEHPDWSIETTFLTLTNDFAVARAEIRDTAGRILSTGHKTQTLASFKLGFAEKAETGAIGRALALIGYGTQFTDELDEEDHIVDTPVARQAQQPARPQQPQQRPVGPNPPPQGELQPMISRMRTPGAMPSRS